MTSSGGISGRFGGEFSMEDREPEALQVWTLWLGMRDPSPGRGRSALRDRAR